MNQPLQAVILCGGLGTRLRPLTDQLPKPMMEVNGKPFLEHLLQQMSDQGIKRFLLLTGYLGEIVRDYFDDGSKWGWVIEYSHGPKEWETGRRLWEARGQLDVRFLLLYSDNFVQFKLSDLMKLHDREQASLTLVLAPKENGNIRVSSTGRIEAYVRTRIGHGLNYVELGYMIIERNSVLATFSKLPDYPDFSFSTILESLAFGKFLAGHIVQDSYHSISDPDRLELMRCYLKPKKILLIDRDGTINKKAPQGEYITNWSKFEWISETKEAMRALAGDGFEFIIITNQAGIARNMINPDDLQDIHKNMVAELASEGVNVLSIYMCPDHWNEDSFMRKPAPGMFFQAAKEYNLRMDRTLYIGDDERDCQAAANAGCGMIYISDNSELPKLAENPTPYFMTQSLQESIGKIRNIYSEWEAVT